VSPLAAFLAVLMAWPPHAAAAPVAPPGSEDGVVRLGQLARPPTIDGALGPGEWDGAGRVELGYQVQPGDNAPPTERTEVFLAADAERLYVAFRALDSEPRSLRARVSRRDDVFEDDYVTMHLDTFDDRRRAYVFHFNPVGVQSDGLYTEGRAVGRDWAANVDASWDGVLASKGSVNGEGYVVEAAIPFATLRYQTGPGRAFGLHLSRWISRKAESVHWRPISRDASSLLVQMGRLTELEVIGARRTLDVIPEVVGSVVDQRRPDGTEARDADGEPGLTATWGLTPNMTLSGTANPDFSQVEADVPQIEVNQRFPLFYPEKRPFFLEGDQYFRSPGALTFVNTRQIVDPDWGGKLAGKSGRQSIGLLAASDRAPGELAVAGSPAAGDNALFGIARYQRDLFQNSTWGGFATTHRFAGASNTVLATDGQLRSKVSVLGFQLARSWTTDADHRSREGSASYLWYEWQGRHLRIFVNDQRVSEDYAAHTGFVRRTGIRANSANLGWEFQPGTPTWWVKVRPFVVIKRQITTAGLLDESYVDPGFDLTLARNVTFYVYRSFHTDSFGGREYGYDFNVIDSEVKPFKRVALEWRLQWGEGVNFDPARTLVGDALDWRFALTFKPDDRLNTEALWLKSRLLAKHTRERLFNQDIARLRVAFQFTRDHGARTIGEYDTRAKRLSLSLLYSYTPRANTAVYLGYGDLLYDGLDPLDLTPRPGWNRSRRTLFLKVSYGFRP
jgi:hypothetical protein